eukprot:TRINITY_DN1098_c0_g2_i4.p1 TRINITY_DN1098_c0_g2~~TRINITY_DN1098_c0_g2_i4.p1  ORF type:complete len:158 (-),score=5.29 TRINITY_DN1098_c0_g2_i4:41-514(-)
MTLLEKLYNEPLYDLDAVNPYLSLKFDTVRSAMEVRKRLQLMKDFIVNCPQKSVLMQSIKTKSYLLDTQLFSMSDLVSLEKANLIDFLFDLASLWQKHIFSCEVCKNRGSSCEFCSNGELLYPFKLKSVFECKNCGSLAHLSCYDVSKCPKCLRTGV